jgi:hypothetical protein
MGESVVKVIRRRAHGAQGATDGVVITNGRIVLYPTVADLGPELTSGA